MKSTKTIEYIHTPEQIKALSFKSEKLSALKILANNTHSLSGDTALLGVVSMWEYEIANELAKYDYLVGTRVRINPKFKSFHGYDGYIGIIEEITHFNNFSKAVRCKVRHKQTKEGKYADGFTGEALHELELID